MDTPKLSAIKLLFTGMFGFAAFTTPMLSVPAFADNSQSVTQCDDALVESTYKSFSSSSVDERMAQYVSNSAYDKVTHDAGGSAVIYGIPVGANYKDFHERSSAQVSDFSSNVSDDEVRNVEWTGLNSLNVAAYQACLDTVKNQRGLHLYALQPTSSDVALAVSWSPIGFDPAGTKVTWSAIGYSTKDLPISLPAGETRVTLPRPDHSVTLAVNDNGYSDSIVLTPIPKQLRHACHVPFHFNGIPQRTSQYVACSGFRSGALVTATFKGRVTTTTAGGGGCGHIALSISMGDKTTATDNGFVTGWDRDNQRRFRDAEIQSPPVPVPTDGTALVKFTDETSDFCEGPSTPASIKSDDGLIIIQALN